MAIDKKPESELEETAHATATWLLTEENFGDEVAEILHNRHRWRWRGLTVWIILFSIAVILMYRANNDRISDIQQSRIISCERNYEAIREVFNPFFPAKKQMTPQEFKNFEKFNRTINRKKASCRQQVSVISITTPITVPSTKEGK